MTGKKIRFIYNPKSGHSQSHYTSDKILSKLDLTVNTIDYFLTTFRGHATELAIDAVKQDYDVVVAIGGDGTVSEIAQALVHSSTALAVLPTGIGNSFANTIKLSSDIDSLLRAIFSGEIECIDTIELKNELFGQRIGLCSLGIGLTAETKHKYAQSKESSFLHYMYCFIWASFQYQTFSAFLNFNFYKEKKTFYELSIMNLNQWGHGVYAIKTAKYDDGLLDVIYMDQLKHLRLYWFSFLVFLGFVDDIRNTVNHYKAEIVSILLDNQINVHIDGEPYQAVGEIEVKVLPQSLQVVCA